MQHCVHLHFDKYIERPENVELRYIMHSRPCPIFKVGADPLNTPYAHL